MKTLLLSLLLVLPLVTAPASVAAGCCPDAACCKSGCAGCKH